MKKYYTVFVSDLRGEEILFFARKFIGFSLK